MKRLSAEGTALGVAGQATLAAKSNPHLEGRDMGWFRNLNIGKQLAVAFGFLEVLIIGIGMFGLGQLSTVNETTVQVVSRQMPSVRVLGALKYDASAVRRSELSHLLATEHKEKWDGPLKQAMTDLEAHEKEYEPLINSDAARRLDEDFRTAWGKYLAVHEREVVLAQDNEYQAGLLAQSEGSNAFEGAASILQDEVVLADKDAAAFAAQGARVYASSRYWIIGFLVGAVLSGFAMSTAIGRTQSVASGRMLAQMEEIAAKNLEIEDVQVDSDDEIGRACVALNTMKNSLGGVIQLITETAMRVASASDELFAAREQITSNSEKTSAEANIVSQAAQRVSQNLQTVSTGAEEMATTIQSISSHAHEAASVASLAVQTAQAANLTVAKLGNSSVEIGEVIKVITAIAQQTNLLALNATIEAARAGSAGKGFAVVANEVKELAKQTAKSTEEIGRKIAAIQSDTKGAVEAIGTIAGVIDQINDISRTIATAVEEQSATTNEMKRNVGEAATGAREISSGIGEVARVADGTSFRAQESQRSAQELSEVAKLLSGLMAQFKIKRRDARVELAVPVMLTIADAKGHPKEQEVQTIDISRHGVLVEGFRGVIRKGKMVFLTRKNKKQEFRVAWAGAKGTPKAGQIGLSAVNPEASIWDDVLPGRELPAVEAAPRSLAAHV
jgi:methyl-accepting chemotaxis protein